MEYGWMVDWLQCTSNKVVGWVHLDMAINGLIYRVSLKSVKALLGTFNKEKALVGACSDYCENFVKFRSQPFYLLVRFTCPAELRSHQRADVSGATYLTYQTTSIHLWNL